METLLYCAVSLPVVFLVAAILVARSGIDLDRFDQAVDACVRLATIGRSRRSDKRDLPPPSSRSQ